MLGWGGLGQRSLGFVSRHLACFSGMCSSSSSYLIVYCVKWSVRLFLLTYSYFFIIECMVVLYIELYYSYIVETFWCAVRLDSYTASEYLYVVNVRVDHALIAMAIRASSTNSRFVGRPGTANIMLS